MDTRERIIAAAAELLAQGGSEAVSTRAVASAADVQAPTLYRLFGDKQGLLDAVTAFGFERYLAEKERLEPTGDPVADLRRGWDNHVEFGLTQPAFYMLMFGAVQPGRRPAAAETAYKLLVGLLERVAGAGRLRMPPEAAARTIHATNTGVVLSLIATPPEDRDPDLATRTRDLLLGAITTTDSSPEAAGATRPAGSPGTGDPAGSSDPAGDAVLATRALALDAVLPTQDHRLSGTEAALLRDWLHRLAT